MSPSALAERTFSGARPELLTVARGKLYSGHTSVEPATSLMKSAFAGIPRAHPSHPQVIPGVNSNQESVKGEPNSQERDTQVKHSQGPNEPAWAPGTQKGGRNSGKERVEIKTRSRMCHFKCLARKSKEDGVQL